MDQSYHRAQAFQMGTTLPHLERALTCSLLIQKIKIKIYPKQQHHAKIPLASLLTKDFWTY
jgi:hypothetical protein